MATQGIISIVKNNTVIYKCIAGCNGMAAKKTAKILKKLTNPSLDDIYNICLKNNFGCEDCLIVQSENNYKGMNYNGMNYDEIPNLYKTKFQDAKFNPRCDSGIADYVEVIETK